MVKEATIRAEALKILRSEGWTVWVPLKARYAKESDIFGVFDAVAVRGHITLWVQWTTYHNLNARRYKVRDFLRKNDVEFNPPAQVWGWHDDEEQFSIVEVT